MAILNNNALYDEIFAFRNNIFQRQDSAYFTLEKTPKYYSNLVTIDENWNSDQIFRAIDRKFEDENWTEWSIKDSFAVLDLEKNGFSRLFEAKWFYLEPENFIPSERKENLRFKVVKNEEDLKLWRRLWDSDEKLGNEIFDSKLLENPDLFFIAGYRKDEIILGCLLNKSEQVLGISNFFSPEKDIFYWSETIKFIYSAISKTKLVGYERMEFVNELVDTLNFESVGNLVVWLKKRSLN